MEKSVTGRPNTIPMKSELNHSVIMEILTSVEYRAMKENHLQSLFCSVSGKFCEKTNSCTYIIERKILYITPVIFFFNDTILAISIRCLDDTFGSFIPQLLNLYIINLYLYYFKCHNACCSINLYRRLFSVTFIRKAYLYFLDIRFCK